MEGDTRAGEKESGWVTVSVGSSGGAKRGSLWLRWQCRMSQMREQRPLIGILAVGH